MFKTNQKLLKTYSYLIIFLFFACKSNENKTDVNSEKQALYTQQDTLNLDGHKFSKKEFNSIIDNFPKLYQEVVLMPNSLYSLEANTNPNFSKSYGENVSFDSDAGQDCYFTLYTYFLQKRNIGQSNASRRKHLNHAFQTINTIFERLSRGGTEYIHKNSCIPAYVEYAIYEFNTKKGKAVLTKQTIAERDAFIQDLTSQIAEESKLADITYEFEKEKMDDLVAKLNKNMTDDFILTQVKAFSKPYIQEFQEMFPKDGEY